MYVAKYWPVRVAHGDDRLVDGWIHGVGEAGVDRDVVAAWRRISALLAQLLLAAPLRSPVREPHLRVRTKHNEYLFVCLLCFVLRIFVAEIIQVVSAKDMRARMFFRLRARKLAVQSCDWLITRIQIEKKTTSNDPFSGACSCPLSALFSAATNVQNRDKSVLVACWRHCTVSSVTKADSCARTRQAVQKREGWRL